MDMLMFACVACIIQIDVCTYSKRGKCQICYTTFIHEKRKYLKTGSDWYSNCEAKSADYWNDACTYDI